MKVKTNFKQMVLVDKLLYNKLNSSPSTLKPDIHVHQTSSLNPFPPNPHHTPPTINSSNPHPNPPHNSKPTPPNPLLPSLPFLCMMRAMNGKVRHINGLTLFNNQTIWIILIWISQYRWRKIQLQLKGKQLSIQTPRKELLCHRSLHR